MAHGGHTELRWQLAERAIAAEVHALAWAAKQATRAGGGWDVVAEEREAGGG
jgi:hypothetical protein